MHPPSPAPLTVKFDRAYTSDKRLSEPDNHTDHQIMKTERRHNLETNALAVRVKTIIDDLTPYASTVGGILAALAVALIGWSYLSGSASSRQATAWNSYNQAIEGYYPNLQLLKTAAEENPGTSMQEIADVTWADGQVWMAVRQMLTSKAGSLELLDKASSAYQSVIRTSKDERVVNRARYGLARVYEMKNEVDKAIEQYNSVQGAFSELSKERAKELGEAKTRLALDWLATAEAPRRLPPMGPGTPGQRPNFSADDLSIPGANDTKAAENVEKSFDDILKGIGSDINSGDAPDRYAPGEKPATEGAPATEGTPPADPATPPATAEPAADTAPAEKP